MDPGQFHWLLYCNPQPSGCRASLILCSCLLSSQWLLDLFSVRGREGHHSPTIFLLTSAVGLWAYALFGNYTTFKAQPLLMVVQDFSKVSSSEIAAPQFTQDWRLSVIPGLFSYSSYPTCYCAYDLIRVLNYSYFSTFLKKFLIMSCVGYCKNLQTGFPASSLTCIHFVLCMAIKWLFSNIS